MSVYFDVPYIRYEGGCPGGAIMVIAPTKTYDSNFIHHDFIQFGKQHIRTVARKFSIGGLCGSAGGFDIIKLTKAPLICSVSHLKRTYLDLPLPDFREYSRRMFSEDNQVSKFHSVKGCCDQPSVLEINLSDGLNTH